MLQSQFQINPVKAFSNARDLASGSRSLLKALTVVGVLHLMYPMR